MVSRHSLALAPQPPRSVTMKPAPHQLPPPQPGNRHSPGADRGGRERRRNQKPTTTTHPDTQASNQAPVSVPRTVWSRLSARFARCSTTLGRRSLLNHRTPELRRDAPSNVRHHSPATGTHREPTAEAGNATATRSPRRPHPDTQASNRARGYFRRTGCGLDYPLASLVARPPWAGARSSTTENRDCEASVPPDFRHQGSVTGTRREPTEEAGNATATTDHDDHTP